MFCFVEYNFCVYKSYNEYDVILRKYISIHENHNFILNLRQELNDSHDSFYPVKNTPTWHLVFIGCKYCRGIMAL